MRVLSAALILVCLALASEAAAQNARWSRVICPNDNERTARCVAVIAVSGLESDNSWVEAHVRNIGGRIRVAFHFSRESVHRPVSVSLSIGPRINISLGPECGQSCTAFWEPTDVQMEELIRENRFVLEFRSGDGNRDTFVIGRRGLIRAIRELQDIRDR
jgi:hypothetical protein